MIIAMIFIDVLSMTAAFARSALVWLSSCAMDV